MYDTNDNRILGLDYGEKRIGVAVSDPTHFIAQGLPTITYKSTAEALNRLEQILVQYAIEKIVVGRPLTMKGQEGFAVKRTDDFVKKLNDRFSLPIEFMDERLSSAMSQRILLELGVSPGRKKHRVDQMAAAIILQGYLDRMNNAADSI